MKGQPQADWTIPSASARSSLWAAGVANAKSVHGSGILARGQGSDCARIKSPAEGHSHRHIRADDDFADRLEFFANQTSRITGQRRRIQHAPVTPLIYTPRIRFNDKQMTSFELAHSRDRSLRLRVQIGNGRTSQSLSDPTQTVRCRRQSKALSSDAKNNLPSRSWR